MIFCREHIETLIVQLSLKKIIMLILQIALIIIKFILKKEKKEILQKKA